jgi:hypothetical protein
MNGWSTLLIPAGNAANPISARFHSAKDQKTQFSNCSFKFLADSAAAFHRVDRYGEVVI